MGHLEQRHHTIVTLPVHLLVQYLQSRSRTENICSYLAAASVDVLSLDSSSRSCLRFKVRS